MSGILRLFGKRKRSKELSENSKDDALTVGSLALADDAELAANVTSSDEEAHHQRKTREEGQKEVVCQHWWLGLDHDSLGYKGAIVPRFKKFISTDTRSINALFTEVREIRSTLEKLQHKDEYKKLNVIGKWMVILKNANLIEMRKLVGALLTVFASNAFCESVFSIAKSIWTPEKSNLYVDTLRALLAIKCNSDVECADM